MDQFKQTYFEECDDRLLEAEEGLTAMLDGQADNDVINKVFRAIHSIKGGAGAFAFDRLVAFAHQFETVLDLVREGKLMPDWDMCQVFLRANDIVATLIGLYKAGSPIADNIGADVLEALTKIAGGEASTNTKAVVTTAPSKTIQTWAITFRPHADMLKSGNEPLFILRALRALGQTTVTAEVDGLPPLAKLVTDQCYLGWRILLKTDAPEHEIREVFDFVEDLSEITITLQDVPPADMPERRKTPEPVAEAPKRRKEDKEQAEVAATGAASIRVDIQRIDQLVNLVGEMVIAQSMLQEQVRWLPPEVGGSIGEGVENLTRHMRDLQESVMAVRAQPIKSVFTRMPRIIREVAAACGKDVRLTTFGEETEVDKTVLENLIDPLTHMIRNSVDHGIETPEVRVAAGKPAYGTIQLSARHKSGRIIIEIEDDGKGINRDAVLAKAKKQGLVADDAVLAPADIDNLIFRAGFSTAEKVSEVSGRGVGMDVVKRNVTALGGRISVHNNPGKGCRMVLALPLTLAVMDGMVVAVGSQRFVLPTVNIVESFRPSDEVISKVAEGVHVVHARGSYVRILPLFDVFAIDDAIRHADEALVILLESDEGEKLAVMVDDVLGQQQVVIKSLETNYTAVDGIAAATILGNGDVALILDVVGLLKMQPHAEVRHLTTPTRDPSTLQGDMV